MAAERGAEIPEAQIIAIVVKDIKSGGPIAKTILKKLAEEIRNGFRLVQNHQ